MGPAPSAPSSGSTSKLLVGVFVVVALLVDLGVGFAAAQSKVTKTQKEVAVVTNDRDAYKAQVDDRAAQQAADDAAVAEAQSDKAAADQAAADHAKNTIPGDGIFAIGSDKAAGTKTPGPSGSSCYYVILSSPNGSGIDNIIDNNNVAGPGIVTLKAGQYFETSGCSDWTRG
jgi:hypothetical protein